MAMINPAVRIIPRAVFFTSGRTKASTR